MNDRNGPDEARHPQQYAGRPGLSPLRSAIAGAYRADEATCMRRLGTEAAAGGDRAEMVFRRAIDLIRAMRDRRRSTGGIEAFLHEYDLDSGEGVLLMCLAEALLRIPDAATADRLIRDKLSRGEWDRHLGHSHSLFVNAGTWGLMLTGRLLDTGPASKNGVAVTLQKLLSRGGEPMVRAALRQAMGIVARQFVMGRTIGEAVDRALEPGNRSWRYSFDMLGEAAVCTADVDRYLAAYRRAIETLAGRDTGRGVAAAGISVKLSALHPRYEYAKLAMLKEELVPRLEHLASLAAAAGVAMTLDAEEADRLEPSLDVFEQLRTLPGLKDWDGFGMAVQAYQKRAPAVIEWLAELADRTAMRIPLRLVKGAYWDTEIKRAQELGLDGYPVYTRKHHTDVSYLACARGMLDKSGAFLPQFATHNAYTVAWVLEHARGREYEFQRLHGMGEALYRDLIDAGEIPGCRVYAPVGSHEELLPYLVRRLLENGANTSFVNRAVEDNLPAEEVVADPVAVLRLGRGEPNPRIPLPRDIYGGERLNAAGIDLSDPVAVEALSEKLAAAAGIRWRASAGSKAGGTTREVTNPADRTRIVGEVTETDDAGVTSAIDQARACCREWDAQGGPARAKLLRSMAERLETAREELIALCVYEAGRTLPDAVAEVREAVDFCRYYAVQTERLFGAPVPLPGPTGESNELSLHGRGVFACISPWNFPLAIFTGQVAAALAAGNTVIAKPAGQTPLMAARAVALFHAAGVPDTALHLLPGGSEIGARLVSSPGIDGVAFTGSLETARSIAGAIAARGGPIVPLIAETGGVNAMIVDNSALPEQVVRDTLRSAFNSAGQRCSALRVLFVQEEIAQRLIDLLTGAMAELTIGDPALLATDVGPVIDEPARQALEAHAARMRKTARVLYEASLPPDTAAGTFFAPAAYQIQNLEQLPDEIFGPILHLVRYRGDRLGEVLDAINASGYGLTLGIHTRIEETAQFIRARVRVGNAYVNRDMIGAVVGVQPFGGEGLSGTGPKVGGPHTLLRYATERSWTVNTAAIGGNAGLYTLDGD